MLPAKTAKYNKQNILDGNPRILLGQEVIYSSGPAHLLASTQIMHVSTLFAVCFTSYGWWLYCHFDNS